MGWNTQVKYRPTENASTNLQGFRIQEQKREREERS